MQAHTYPASYEDAFLAQSTGYAASGDLEGYSTKSRKTAWRHPAEVGTWAIFPSAFTLFCIIVFFIPIWILSTYIGQDMNAVFFLGTSGARPVLFLPVLYFTAHVMHVCIGRPSKSLMLICLIGSTLMILVLGDQVAKASERNAAGLLSPQCESFTAKSELESQWQTARTFYATCMLATANQTNSSFQDDVQKYRVRDCAGYEQEAALNPSWSYLQKLEEKQRCAGWCSKSQALWTLEPVKESCSMAVGEVMSHKIHRAAKQVVAYALFTLIFLLTGACVGAPVLNEWFVNGGA